MAIGSTDPSRRALALWAAIVVPMWLVLALCAYWEPVVRDGWGHLQWQRTHDVTPSWVWAYAKASYYQNNPRIGQVITLLLYTPGPWHVAITPLVELAMFYLVTALVLGRWPSPRKPDDARTFLIVCGVGAATMPCIGQMLAYRPYTGNYVYALVLMLLLAIPYRFHGEAPRAYRWWLAPLVLVLGFAAGLGNEHTGVAVGAALLAAIACFVRRGDRLAPWMIAGVVGLAAGTLVLLLAPGHAHRYDAIATKQTMFETFSARGVVGNARVIARLLVHVAIALPWLAVAWLRRDARLSRPTVIACWLAVGAAVLATCALFASPRVGDRLYLAPTLWCTIAVAAWVDAQARARRMLAGLSIVALVGLGAICIGAYAQLGPAGRQRLDTLDRAAPGSAVVLDRLPVEKNYFTIGEDLDDTARAALIAKDRGLAGVTLRK